MLGVELILRVSADKFTPLNSRGRQREGERMPPRHHHLRAAAEGGGGGLSQDGVHLGLGFNEGGASVCAGMVVGRWGSDGRLVPGQHVSALVWKEQREEKAPPLT